MVFDRGQFSLDAALKEVEGGASQRPPGGEPRVIDGFEGDGQTKPTEVIGGAQGDPAAVVEDGANRAWVGVGTMSGHWVLPTNEAISN